MRPTINLVPSECLSRRVRRRRRNLWLSIAVVTVVVCIPLWAMRVHGSAVTERVNQQLALARAAFDADEGALQRDQAEHDDLLDVAEQLSSLWQPQPWSARLANLTRTTPSQVFMTELTAIEEPNRARTASDLRPSSKTDSVDSRREESAGPRLTVSIRGLALDHPALTRFIRALEGTDDYGKAELVRAVREPYRSGLAVMFEVKCPLRDHQ